MSATGQSMAAQDACARWMPRKQTYCARVAPGTARPARLPRRWNASGSELLSGGLRASLPQRPRRAGTRRTSSSGSASPRNASRRCWRPRDTLAPSAASHSVISGSALTTTRVQFLIRLGCARAREVIDRRGRTDALMAGKLGHGDVLSRRLRRLSCVTGSHGSRPFRAR
jgi:hypothetical protein